MMRFLADMGVNIRVVEWLRNNGHDAKHLREEGLHRMPNGEIFTKALNENRIIITFDLDFGEIVALSEGKKASVVLFRLHNTRTPHLIRRLSTLQLHKNYMKREVGVLESLYSGTFKRFATKVSSIPQRSPQVTSNVPHKT